MARKPEIPSAKPTTQKEQLREQFVDDPEGFKKFYDIPTQPADKDKPAPTPGNKGKQ